MSRTNPSPTTPSAAGELESAANSFEITTKPANFFGVMSTSSSTASLTFSSAPSAHHAAVGSVVTRGTLKVWLAIC